MLSEKNQALALKILRLTVEAGATYNTTQLLDLAHYLCVSGLWLRKEYLKLLPPITDAIPLAEEFEDEEETIPNYRYPPSTSDIVLENSVEEVDTDDLNKVIPESELSVLVPPRRRLKIENLANSLDNLPDHIRRSRLTDRLYRKNLLQRRREKDK
jgi:hypothetical protein